MPTKCITPLESWPQRPPHCAVVRCVLLRCIVPQSPETTVLHITTCWALLASALALFPMRPSCRSALRNPWLAAAVAFVTTMDVGFVWLPGACCAACLGLHATAAGAMALCYIAPLLCNKRQCGLFMFEARTQWPRTVADPPLERGRVALTVVHDGIDSALCSRVVHTAHRTQPRGPGAPPCVLSHS